MFIKMQFSFNHRVKLKRKISNTGILLKATGRNQFFNDLRAKNHLPFNKHNRLQKTKQKWLENDFDSCKTKTKYWAICSGLTDNTDNYSRLEPPLPNVQTHLVQSLDSEPRESRVIVVTSGKGGVGKTTATANIGMSIARLGYKVVVIDADIGLKNLDLLLGLENRILYTVMDVFEGQCRLDQALIRDKRWKNLSLLSISKNRQRYNVTRKNMQNLVSALTNLNFQYIFIDCPAGIDVGFINAISPAKEALIVTTSELPAMRDADRVAGLLEANGIFQMKLLVNRVRSDMIQKNDMMSVRDVQEALGVPLLGAIPEDSEIIISTNRGEPLVLKKKLSLSGIAFENAARRLVGKQDYFVDLNAPYKGLLAQFIHSIKNF